MFHAWGFSQLIFAATMACTIVTRRKFDPEATLELVDRHGTTGLAVVPVMFDRIMELPEGVRNRYSGRSLRFAAASGSRIRPDVVTAFMDQFGDVIYNNYNATEAGATLFGGYTSGKTKDFHDGFMASGDMGYVDGNGRLFVVGRDDEMIVSGGENVYPIDVEKTLASHADVAEAAVIGVDDEQYGQRLAAFVVLNDGAGVTPDTLKQHVRESLANYKVPRQVTVPGELPRSITGKIVRKDLDALVDNG